MKKIVLSSNDTLDGLNFFTGEGVKEISFIDYEGINNCYVCYTKYSEKGKCRYITRNCRRTKNKLLFYFYDYIPVKSKKEATMVYSITVEELENSLIKAAFKSN